MIDLIPPITSWVVFIAAAGVFIQNFLYLKRNRHRRQDMHFAFATLSLYMASLYLIAALDPAVWIIRTGIATKIGIIILLYMIFSITHMDENEQRQENHKK